MSCSLGQALYPSNEAVSLSSSEASYSFSHIMQGYDNEFVPHPEPRYECPICLLVLREPRQTRCGHRFCRDCIIRSLRDSSNRCPVDNEPLRENDIYPDNFAKREILNFNIKCPNNKEGCEKVFPLGKLQSHLEECPLALTPCPYRCACIMQRIDVEDHLANFCENRIVSCEYCHIDLQARTLQNHGSVCPSVTVACPHCREKKLRHEMEFHVQAECQQVEVHCPFFLMGCAYKMKRSAVDEHINRASPSHMKQLCYAVTSIAQKMGIMHLIRESSPTSLPESLGDMLSVVHSASIMQDHFASSPANMSSSSNPSLNSENVLALLQPLRAEAEIGRGERIQAISLEKSLLPFRSFDDGQHRVTQTQYQSDDPAYYYPTSPLNDSDAGPQQLSLQSSHVPRPKPPVRRISYQPHHTAPTSSMLGNSQPQGPHYSVSLPTTQMSNQASSNAARIVQEMNAKFEEREAQQTQKMQELLNKCSAIEQVNSDLMKKVKDLEQQLAEKDAKFYSGDFYWIINKFSHYQAKLASGESSMLHSPPFYTSPWGYKLCIRANIDRSPEHGPQLSLFIHFMKSKNDTMLAWPFSGKIIICVIDQNPDQTKRMHIKETLEANPNLAAFQKPTTLRNHKGFGYIDFMSVSALEGGTFIVDDTLIVRAQVFPDYR